MGDFIGTATYSPEDNKLRIYPFSRLDKDTYLKVKAAGFIWAPKQEIFVAPMWTPGREDMAVELCGEIGDEDTSLVDRAEQRAERFEDYSENRRKDAESAKKAVNAIADNIPFGQPILVGHHSEKRARKDAERIDNGMRKAVKMWEQSAYWTSRAEGAIRAAKYKELPAVRARRIKGIEADKRKTEKSKSEAEKSIELWTTIKSMTGDMQHKAALQVSNYSHFHACFTLDKYPREAPISQYEGSMSLWGALDNGIITAGQAADLVIPANERAIPRLNRWIAHYENRLSYEKSMLAEGGGLIADQCKFVVGGQVRHRFGWSIIKRLNKKDGVVVSVSLAQREYPTVVQVEDVKEYKHPTEEQAAAVVTATKLPPMCNYITPDCATMTQEEYTKEYVDHKGSKAIAATDTHGVHRIRTIAAFRGRKYGSISKDQWDRCTVFISDAKVKEAPLLNADLQAVKIPKPIQEIRMVPKYKEPERTEFDDMKDAIKAGVKVVSAPQLFPTPPELAKRLVDLADVQPGQRVLEPSAGTGNIVQAIINRCLGADLVRLVLVEINQSLASELARVRDITLYANEERYQVKCADFLTCNGDLGKFDRVVMNPPFANGEDIKHIKHAMTFLKPGGKLVAICANGPRQQKDLKVLGEWIDLEPGTFKASGTNVNAAILIIEA